MAYFKLHDDWPFIYLFIYIFSSSRVLYSIILEFERASGCGRIYFYIRYRGTNQWWTQKFVQGAIFPGGGGGGSAPLWFWSPWKPKLLLIQRLSPSLYQTFVTKKSSRQWQGHFIFSSSVICMMYSNKTFLHPNSLILFIPNLLWFVRTWIRTQPWPWSCPVLTTVLYPIIRMGIRGH